MGNGGKLGPGRVGTEVAGRKVSQGPGLQVPDRQLDHRVLSVLGFNDPDLLAAVGDEGVIPPARQELLLVR